MISFGSSVADKACLSMIVGRSSKSSELQWMYCFLDKCYRINASQNSALLQYTELKIQSERLTEQMSAFV